MRRSRNRRTKVEHRTRGFDVKAWHWACVVGAVVFCYWLISVVAGYYRLRDAISMC